jgi:hypothetical protein
MLFIVLSRPGFGVPDSFYYFIDVSSSRCIVIKYIRFWAYKQKNEAYSYYLALTNK